MTLKRFVMELSNPRDTKFSDRVYSLKPFYHCRRARLTILFTSSHLNQNDDDIQRAFHIISLICLLVNGTWLMVCS